MRFLAFTLMMVMFASFSSQLEAVSKKSPGIIRVVKIIGNVAAYNPETGIELHLSSGDVVKQNYTIETGSQSSVVLLFSNGSTIYLEERTKLHIQTFLQQPYSASVATLNQLKSEPSTSSTSLRLDYGKIIGSVKKLNVRDGSTYDMDSAVGIAGIRGTVFSFEIDRSFLDQVASFPSEGSFAIQEGDGFFIPKYGDKEELYLISDLENLDIDTNATTQVLSLSLSAASSMAAAAGEATAAFESFPATAFDPDTNDIDTTTVVDAPDVIDGSEDDASDDATTGDETIETSIIEDDLDLPGDPGGTTSDSDPPADQGEGIDKDLLQDVGIPPPASP